MRICIRLCLFVCLCVRACVRACVCVVVRMRDMLELFSKDRFCSDITVSWVDAKCLNLWRKRKCYH